MYENVVSIYIYIYIYISATALAVCVSRAQYIIIKIYNIVYRIDIGDPPANCNISTSIFAHPSRAKCDFCPRMCQKTESATRHPVASSPIFFWGGVGALFRWSFQLVCMCCSMLTTRHFNTLKIRPRRVQDSSKTRPRLVQEASRALNLARTTPPPPPGPRVLWGEMHFLVDSIYFVQEDLGSAIRPNADRPRRPPSPSDAPR